MASSGIDMPKDAKIQISRSSIHLDLGLIDRLLIVQRICLFVVTLICPVTLAGWSYAPIGRLLPGGWMLMKANTALAGLCSTISLTLSQPKRSSRMLAASHIF